ncbi:MAG: Uma2 family endonuclease [Chloroflexi bacterium]|nr:Uma2 family endonuclease [Chloroflexota bacterium]
MNPNFAPPILPRLKSARPLLRDFVYYPDSDGEPMAENDLQYLCITDTRFMLDQHFAGRKDVYVAADLLVYYSQGDPTKSVAPDVFVAFNVPKGIRRSYMVWEERRPPDVVFEVAFEGTWRADLGWKFGLYMGLGVREYFLFDPTGEFLDPLLQGHRLRDHTAEAIPALPGGRGLIGLRSEQLGLELWARATGDPERPYQLRLYDPAADFWLRTPAETEAERSKTEAALRKAEGRARAAEAEAARLRAELARLRGEPSG